MRLSGSSTGQGGVLFGGLWLLLGVALVLGQLAWALQTQSSPLLPLLLLLAWGGAGCGLDIPLWLRRRPRPSCRSLLLGLAALASIAAVGRLARPTSLAYALPLLSGLAMVALAQPLRHLGQASRRLLLLAIPLCMLPVRWLLPEAWLSRATAGVSIAAAADGLRRLGPGAAPLAGP